MTCCPKGIYSLLVNDCSGATVKMPADGFARVGDLVLGADIIESTVDPELTGNAIVFVDATAEAVTIDLPPVSIGTQIIVKKIDSSGNAVTLDGDGSETIDGSTTHPLSSQYDSVHIVGTVSEWLII